MGKWQDGALLAEGEFFNIDHDRKVLQIKCPQDKIILKLNADLNRTYLWYGNREQREAFAANQLRKDANAESLAQGTAASRSIAKSGGGYSNRFRCLVDTFQDDLKILEKVKEEDLPDVLRDLPAGEREQYVQDQLATRKKIQAEIARVARDREAFLTKERQRLAEHGEQDTLGSAIVAAVSQQLEELGFDSQSEN